MLRTLNTLFLGASARSEEALRDHFAIELIDQKIRETEKQLKVAKTQLALLIQRERSEARLKDQLDARIEDLTLRAKKALEGDREDLAIEAAEAIATLENERTLRAETQARLEGQVLRLRQSVDTGHRRIIDLKQGATMARSLKREHNMQIRLNGSASITNSAEEAEELISRVLKRDDPYEQAEILREINEGLGREDVAGRMAEAGFGSATKSTASDVLARLKST